MNKKLKAKWLRALRSGQYKQGQSCLVSKSGDNFCCLGVLADVQGCVWKEDECGQLHPIMPRGRKTFGINSIGAESTSYLKPIKAGGLNLTEQCELANLNDGGKTFKQIADYIEAKL